MQQRITKSVQRKRWPDEVYARAQEVLETRPDATPSSIASLLAEEFDPAPQPKTIGDWITRGVIERPDPSQLWTLAGAEPGEAAIVLPVLRWLITNARGPARLTVSRARWIARIVDAAPGIPIPDTVRLASLYEEPGGLALADLDHYLAFRPWESDEAAETYQQAFERHWIDSVLLPGAHGSVGRSTLEDYVLATKTAREFR